MKKKEEISLSMRLKALTDMVTVGNTVADVGCDHGFLSIYLVQHKISPKVLAMDVRKGPLQAATQHIREAGLESCITTRLSDGLEKMDVGECESLVVAGMGGKLMQKILTDNREKTRSLKEMILQPQSEISEFRQFLRQEKLQILDENVLVEAGKYYFMMRVVPVEEVPAEERDLQPVFDAYGKTVLLKKHPVLLEYLEKRREVLTKLCEELEKSSKEKTKIRLQEVEAERKMVLDALKFYE